MVTDELLFWIVLFIIVFFFGTKSVSNSGGCHIRKKPKMFRPDPPPCPPRR